VIFLNANSLVYSIFAVGQTMKNKIQYLLQRVLGFEKYLFCFSIFKILTLRFDRRENDFLFFLQHVGKGQTILDIGANIGIMTVIMAKKFPDRKIIAYEPMPVNVKILKKVVAFFSLQNVTIEEVALGNRAGTVEMVMPVVGKTKKQGLSHVMHETIGEYNDGDLYTVPLKTLDEMPNAGELSIAAIKMDVENFECFVLEGARETLCKQRPLIYCELWENENRNACIDLMRSLNYKVMIRLKNQWVHFDPKQHRSQNFFFLP
jgi:FkbM family methyltransferase